MSSSDIEISASPPSTILTMADNESTTYLNRVSDAIREGASIAGILRVGGATLMVFSLSLFLMQGFETTSDLNRYLLLLGQTALLTGAGFAVGLILKEPRGARVFFSLALISIPANFAVLGAMIYSIVPLDEVITSYPTYASWQSTDLKELLLASVAGLAILVPMSVFCFAVLARQSKLCLSAVYLLASAALLIPLRETFSITIISSICAFAVVSVLTIRYAKQARPSTGEEKFANMLLFIPAVLMLSRSAMLYAVDFQFALAAVIVAYYLLRHVVVSRSGSSALTLAIQLLSASCAAILSFMLAMLVSSDIPDIVLFMGFSAAWFVLNMDLTRFIESTKLRSVIHGIWALVLFSAITIDVVALNLGNGILINLILGIILLAASTMTQQKLIAILGVISIITVLMFSGFELFSFMLNTGWIGMAIAGFTAIVAGSVLERFRPRIKIQIGNRFNLKKVACDDTNAPDLQENMTTDSQIDEQLTCAAA